VTTGYVALPAERAEVGLVRTGVDITFQFRFGVLVISPEMRVEYTTARLNPVAEAT
jgi:hypothetical protein